MSFVELIGRQHGSAECTLRVTSFSIASHPCHSQTITISQSLLLRNSREPTDASVSEPVAPSFSTDVAFTDVSSLLIFSVHRTSPALRHSRFSRSVSRLSRFVAHIRVYGHFAVCTKNTPWRVCDLFFKYGKFLSNILHAYSAFESTPNCKVSFNYP